MFKGILTEVALEVGNSGAILLNQLGQWFKSKDITVVYRTNSELAEDLCGILSLATIQRAKVKLVDKGYVEVSFDKGLNRTTHYKLTEKAKKVLGLIKDEVSTPDNKPKKPEGGVVPAKAVAKKVAKPEDKKPQGAVAKPTYVAPTQLTPKAMQESFKEQGARKEPMPIPENLKALLKGKVAKVEAPVVEAVEEVKAPVELPVQPQDLYEDNSEELFQKKGSWIDQEISDEEYFASMDAVINLAFNQVPNAEQRNKNLADLQAMAQFKGEEW